MNDDLTRRCSACAPPLVQMDSHGLCPSCGRKLSDGTEQPDDEANAVVKHLKETLLNAVVGERYEIREYLGHGGMGVVFRAFDRHLGLDIAIKFLMPMATESEAARRRFFQEARRCLKLTHESIVRVYNLEVLEDATFITMELLQGSDLRGRIAACSRLSVAETLGFGIQVCDGLEYAHRKGLVHRDMKPGNVFLTSRGVAKILDFGLAKAFQTDAPGATDARLTRAGCLIGTPAYMSPEQIRAESADRLDPRSDIYSTGVLLYECLAGRLPFPDANAMDLLAAHLRDAPDPLSSVRTDVPRALEETILHAIEKSPSDRHETARELAEDLRRISEDGRAGTPAKIHPVGARVEPVPPPPGAAAAQPASPALPRRSAHVWRAVFLVALLAAVVSLLGAGSLLSRRRGDLETKERAAALEQMKSGDERAALDRAPRVESAPAPAGEKATAAPGIEKDSAHLEVSASETRKLPKPDVRQDKDAVRGQAAGIESRTREEAGTAEKQGQGKRPPVDPSASLQASVAQVEAARVAGDRRRAVAGLLAAAAMDPNSPDVGALRERVTNDLEASVDGDLMRMQSQRAEEELALLEQVDPPSDVKQFYEEKVAKRKVADPIFEEAADLVRRDEIERAAEAYQRVRLADASHPGLPALLDSLVVHLAGLDLEKPCEALDFAALLKAVDAVAKLAPEDPRIPEARRALSRKQRDECTPGAAKLPVVW